MYNVCRVTQKPHYEKWERLKWLESNYGLEIFNLVWAKRRVHWDIDDSDDSDDEERGIKLLSPEDLKACKILPFRYVPPPKGKPRGALPEFNRVVGHDDMKDDEDFLTMPKL